MIFIGPFYQPEMEKVLLKDIPMGRLSNAANQYQVDLLAGLVATVRDLEIINVLPVGTWPKYYKHLILRDRRWQFDEKACFEVGGINLPVFKQWIRTRRILAVLKKRCKVEKEVIIYSAYLPFLDAVQKLPADVKVTLVITDLPEYYDLGRTSFVKQILRKINNYFVYKKLARIDRYVLLTEKMRERLPVGDKPYTIVEGIWNQKNVRQSEESAASAKKAVFYAGTLHRQFGIMTLLEAFGRLENEVELWICGSGDCEEEIKAAAEKDKRIRFWGYVSSDEVEKLRNQATVLVNPRPNDGEYTKYSFPSKTMGYMASGKPVVMCKLDGIPDEYDQYLVYAKDSSVDALVEALNKVFAMSKMERERLGNGAKQFIAKSKNAVTQAQKIVDMIGGM